MNQTLNKQLLEASEEGDINKVKQLIESGANVNHANNYGSTPLIWARNLEMVKYLIENGANVNHANNFGSTPLRLASENGHFDIVKYLTEHGANVNHADNDGFTPLMFASGRDDLEIVKYLTEHGANVNQAGNNGSTPLIWASSNGNSEIVKYLTEHGANVNHASNYGFTPLFLASSRGHLEIVKYLIEHGVTDWSPIKNNLMFQEILNKEMNKLKNELTKNYLALKKGTPQTVTGTGKVKSLLPKNLLLKTIYEKPYQEYCSSVNGKLPPIQLIALANILKLDYDLNISWTDLCDKIKHVLYLLL